MKKRKIAFNIFQNRNFRTNLGQTQELFHGIKSCSLPWIVQQNSIELPKYKNHLNQNHRPANPTETGVKIWKISDKNSYSIMDLQRSASLIRLRKWVLLISSIWLCIIQRQQFHIARSSHHTSSSAGKKLIEI